MQINHITPFPELQTERLRLRNIRFSDAPEVYAIRSDPKMSEFTNRPLAQSLDDATAHIQRLLDGYEEEKWINWTMVFHGDQRTIGNIGFWNYDHNNNTAEIGYEMQRTHHGKGFMSETMKVILDFGFQQMKLNKICAHLHGQNIKSLNLLRRFHFAEIADFVDEDEPNLVKWELMKNL